MTFKQEVTLKQPEDITIMLLGSKETIKNTEMLRSYLLGMIKARPDKHLEWLESNLEEILTYMRKFNHKLEE